MRKKGFRSIVLLCVAFLPMISFASVTIVNNTDLFITGKVKSSPCSSTLGDNGVLKPHSQLVFSRSEISLVCGRKPCDGNFYPSKDCSGNSIGTVTVQRDSGIRNIVNHDPEHFRLSGGGSQMTIDSVQSIFTKISKWFGF